MMNCYAVTREAFLQLTLPERIKLWAEDRELEEYILTRAFSYKVNQAKFPHADGEIKVAIIGSGPAGLGCSDVLNQLGFKVTEAKASFSASSSMNSKLQSIRFCSISILLNGDSIKFIPN